MSKYSHNENTSTVASVSVELIHGDKTGFDVSGIVPA